MIYLNPTYWLSHLSMSHRVEGESVFPRLKSSWTDPHLDLGVLSGSLVNSSHIHLLALMALESRSWLPVSHLFPVGAPEQSPGFSLTFNLQPLWQWQENPSHAFRLSDPFLATAPYSLIFLPAPQES